MSEKGIVKVKLSRTGRSRKEKVALAKRRHQVGELYVQGHKQLAIGQQIGVSQQTVSNDLKAIQNQWRNSSVRDFDAVRDKELEKLDRIERECWAAWERSQKPAQSAVVSNGGDRQKTQKTVKEQHGDPRYLEQILKCISSRRALLGLDAPVRVAPTSPDGDEAYHAHVMKKLMDLAEKAGDGPVVVDAQFIAKELELKNPQIETEHERANEPD